MMLSVSGSILGAIVFAGTVVVPATASADRLDWQPCPDVPEVPVDWAHPNGLKTHIGLAMRPAKTRRAGWARLSWIPAGRVAPGWGW
jgi:hypothetical protein